ncbi:MAG: diadenylate cyclase CdaA [Rhodothermales bacterium]|nr:diadenylate cyclase CdaA [Rhodothermales bacterium]
MAGGLLAWIPPPGPGPVLGLKIGFIPFEWLDLLDILIVAFLVYQLYRLIRGTIAVQIAMGLLAIYIVTVVVRALGLTALQALFGAVSEVFVIAVIVLFQPEIRRLLFMLGRNPLVRRFVQTPAREKAVDEVVAAVVEMSESRIGSLIAFARSTGLRNYAESGTPLSANVERDLLTSIFFPNSPLHDGAVIIEDQKIAAARCILPVSEGRRLDPHLGLRHRAAVGLTERTDAFVVVTSEETGRISVAEHGMLQTSLEPQELRARLVEALIQRREEPPAEPPPEAEPLPESRPLAEVEART